MQISFRLSRVPAATPEEQIFEITLNIKKMSKRKDNCQERQQLVSCSYFCVNKYPSLEELLSETTI